jgi:hypothetical protein
MIANVIFSVAIFATLSYVTLSFKRAVSPRTLQMSTDSCKNEISINDISKNDVNRVLQATASVMSAFSIATAANAYGKNRLQFLLAVVLHFIIITSRFLIMRLIVSIKYYAGAVSDQVKVKKAVKTVPKVLETELGIKYIELKKGSGAFPTPNDYVIINYRYGMCSSIASLAILRKRQTLIVTFTHIIFTYSGFLSNGTAFDTTEQKGRKPLSFRIGKKQVQKFDNVTLDLAEKEED